MTTKTEKECWFRIDLPPPITGSYEPAGTWEETGSFRSYITGLRDAKEAVIMIYDIFGPSSQALQGADHISQHFDNCIVIMPDLFKGSALGYDQRAKAREFLAGPGHFSLNASAVRLDVVPAVPLPVVTGQTHPGGLDVANAKGLKGPHICLASGDEDKDVVAGYATILADSSPNSVVETYANMFHGWMGTRANLDDKENRVEYEAGYRQVAEFFSRHL